MPPLQILDCLLPAACRRDEAAQLKLVNFAGDRRFTSTGNFTKGDLETYSDLMCMKGYMGR
jgi:hypothetical protein